jgi:hypothetical protein
MRGIPCIHKAALPALIVGLKHHQVPSTFAGLIPTNKSRPTGPLSNPEQAAYSTSLMFHSCGLGSLAVKDGSTFWKETGRFGRTITGRFVELCWRELWVGVGFTMPCKSRLTNIDLLST